MARIPKIDDNGLQAICDVLGDTAAVLTGRQRCSDCALVFRVRQATSNESSD